MFKSTAAHWMSWRPETWNAIKWRLIFRPDTSCSLLQERHFRDSQKKTISWLYGKIRKHHPGQRSQNNLSVWVFCLVRAQMCRTDNTFSLWLMRPAHSESQICKARGIHPQMWWNSLPENKLPKNWLAPTKLCTSWFSDQTNQLTTSLATGFSSRQDGKQSSK